MLRFKHFHALTLTQSSHRVKENTIASVCCHFDRNFPKKLRSSIFNVYGEIQLFSLPPVAPLYFLMAGSHYHHPSQPSSMPAIDSVGFPWGLLPSPSDLNQSTNRAKTSSSSSTSYSVARQNHVPQKTQPAFIDSSLNQIRLPNFSVSSG